jgi:hypothetical protein
MTSELDRLVAIEAIKVLKARYFRYLDARRWDDLANLFTPDCQIYCQPDPDAVIVGPAEFVSFVAAGITPGLSVHHGHMPEIDVVDADHATGIWAMADIVRTDRPRGSMSIAGYGHYHESYRRGDDGRWQIAELRLSRLLVDDTSAVLPRSAGATDSTG